MTAFFPGYPILIRLVHGVTLGTLSYLDAAMVVSWLALIGATIMLYRLVVRHVDERSAVAASVLLCWFPSSVFFLAPYSETLLLFEILVVVTLLDQRRFLLASLVAAYASASSPEAVTLIVAIVVAAALCRKPVVRIAGYVAVSVSGLFVYALFLQARFGSLVEFEHVQGLWHSFGERTLLRALSQFRRALAVLPGPGTRAGRPEPDVRQHQVRLAVGRRGDDRGGAAHRLRGRRRRAPPRRCGDTPARVADPLSSAFLGAVVLRGRGRRHRAHCRLYDHLPVREHTLLLDRGRGSIP